MRTDSAPLIHLSAYTPPAYGIDRVSLTVTLMDHKTHVITESAIRATSDRGVPLILDGEDLVLEAIEIDGRTLTADEWSSDERSLTIHAPPKEPFTLKIITQLDPAANTKLMGLYKSSGNYCTQCEAEGFRRITYFIDRPDVMAVYTTKIIAEKKDAPVLLGNGNLVDSGSLDNGWHYATWHDPHPKPSYLFALVGGQLGKVSGTFTTRSGRKVDLGIYVERGKENRAGYALDALIRSMEWDERVFGCEYDLDIFNIVAVSDFNMGAMENKGLNIFNDKYILASPETATDMDYLNIEAIIAHEYFHNWTGNRITCRDWFQLCLKEGLTVFRDQEFTSDQRSRAVKRIADVRNLRSQQFVEDSGPLAHPVRPNAYREINNFYTPTVYEKGAELIRMLKILIGADAFKRGMDLYLSRCDGTAATMEDFLSCFAEASGQDLSHFSLWYQQAGTPHVTIEDEFDHATGEWTIRFAQMTPPTPGQFEKRALPIPVALGFLDHNGQDLSLDPKEGQLKDGVFLFDTPTAQLTFSSLKTKPVLSPFRGFSAPVILTHRTDEAETLIRIAHDSDPFNRWQATQDLMFSLLKRGAALVRAGDSFTPSPHIAAALRPVFGLTDHAFAAQLLSLPSEADIAREIGNDIDPDSIRDARRILKMAIGTMLHVECLALIDALPQSKHYVPDADHAGRRALRLAVLDYLASAPSPVGKTLVGRLYDDADNMTDQFGALSILVHSQSPRRDEALAAFAKTFADDPLVLDKWFTLQATVPETDTLDRVKKLMGHPGFSKTNPNRLRALVGAFAMANPSQFHRRDGQGHAFVSEIVIETDRINPQVAARILGAFKTWRALESGRQKSAKEALEQIAAIKNLSTDVADIVGRMLAPQEE